MVDSTQHITGLVEALHGQIQRLAPPLRRRPPAALGGDGLPPSRGLSRLVYRSIQAGTGLVGVGLDRLLASADLAGVAGPTTPRRDALVSALNGVLGDSPAARAAARAEAWR